MNDLAPMLGYYGFLVFLLLFGLVLKFGLDHIKKKKENLEYKK